MSRLVGMLIFITIGSAIFFSMHVFVYHSITRSLTLSPETRKIMTWLFLLCGSSTIAHLFLSHQTKIHFLGHFGYSWLGVVAIAFFIFLVQRCLALVFSNQQKRMTIISLVLIALISIYSLLNGLQTPRVKTLNIPIKNLPATAAGFKIVQISDLHMDPYKGIQVMATIIERVNALNPDLIVITGDLIDDGVSSDPRFLEQMQRLKAPFGVIAITGNHEYYAGIGTFLNLTRNSHIKVLLNESITLSNGIQIIGLEDDQGSSFNKGGPDLKKALKGCEPSKPMILLYHRPFFHDFAIQQGVDLQLSGHTHAGQIPPMDLLVWLYYKYPVGLFEKNGVYLYTSPGTGYWGPAMRLLSSPEITLFTLHNKP